VRASATGSKSATTSGKEAKPAKDGQPTKDSKPTKDGKPTKEAKAAPPAHRLLADAPIRGMAVSPDGRTIATTHESQHVMVWDASTGAAAVVQARGRRGDELRARVAFSPDGASLASGATSVKRFEVATGTELEGLPGHPKGEIRCIAWSDAGLLTVSGKSVQKADNSFAVWEPSGKLRGQWKWELPELAAFVPNEKDALFVSGYRDSRTQAVLTRFDTKQGKVTAEVPLESPFFAVTSSGVWVFDASKAQARLLGLEKLEVRATVALDGAVAARRGRAGDPHLDTRRGSASRCEGQGALFVDPAHPRRRRGAAGGPQPGQLLPRHPQGSERGA
jgi:WD40 repeat protein